jgi:hypothetical protein
MNEREIDEIDNEEYMLNEMYTGPSQTTEMYTVENNNCKGKNGLILFLVFTTLLFSGLFTYYLFVSKKCKEKPTEIDFDKLIDNQEFTQWLNATPKKGPQYGSNFKRIDNDLNFQKHLAAFSRGTTNTISHKSEDYDGNHFAEPDANYNFNLNNKI